MTPAVQEALNAAAAALGAGPLVNPGDRGWRKHYRSAFRRLTELEGPDGNPAAARAGLEVLHEAAPSPERAEPAVADESDTAKPSHAPARCPAPALSPALPPEIISPLGLAACAAVAAHPQWWSLSGRTVVVLGAGAELAPTLPLIAAGAHVHAVIRSNSQRRPLLSEAARTAPGMLTFAPAELSDILAAPDDLADHLASLPGELAVVNALYAPGRANVHLALAADRLVTRLLRARRDVTLAYSGTPTDSYWINGRVRDAALSAQGPNYLAAKRIDRWRATVARVEGIRVLAPVLPPTLTESVLVSSAIERGLSGARHFGIHAAPPHIAARLAATWLIHSLHTPADAAPWTGYAAPAGMWQKALLSRLAAGITLGG